VSAFVGSEVFWKDVFALQRVVKVCNLTMLNVECLISNSLDLGF
jgi:hypothetical protein